jgi:reactive intermediate/imine deaminase
MLFLLVNSFVVMHLCFISPAFVFLTDCELDRAVETTLRSSFANSGQICLCGSRIIVENEIYDLFLEKFVAKVKSSIVVGPPNATTTMGPVVSEQHRAKIEGMIKTAVDQGGQILLGGKRPQGEWANKGFYLEPTIIVGLNQSCQAIQEEIFGPVVTISRFSGYDEALQFANGVKYGLSATVWSSNLEKAHRFAQNLESGMVWVNNWLVRDLSTPFGGVKSSGVGREGGRYSLEFFSESKNIYIHIPPLVAPPAASDSAAVQQRAPVVSVAPLVSHGSSPNNNGSAKVDGHDGSEKGTTTSSGGVIEVSSAPKAVGAYPHARRHGDFLFLSGIGPRTPVSNLIPGGPIRDTEKKPLPYDVKAQTRQVIENVRTVLAGCGAKLEDIIDIQVFLIDMDRDFADFNSVYTEYFSNVKATRTTIAINALPTPIAVEFKVIALSAEGRKS